MAMVCLFSFGLIAPLLSAGLLTSNSQQNLPACCRNDGKHRCAMRQKDSGTGMRGLAEKCPCGPSASLTFQPHCVTLPRTAVFSAALVGPTSAVAQGEALGRISFSRTRQKRGPPSPPSSRLR